MRARKAGGAQPIQFSPAQQKHVEAFKNALTKAAHRYEREAEKRIRKEEQDRAETRIKMTIHAAAAEQSKTWRTEVAARKGAAFTVDEYRLLQKAIQPNSSPSDQTRHEAAVLLNGRADMATGGLWGKKGAP